MDGDDLKTVFETLKARPGAIAQERCVPPPIGCGAQVDSASFKDGLSRKEYRISGLCQACQDRIFAEPEERDEAIPEAPETRGDQPPRPQGPGRGQELGPR